MTSGTASEPLGRQPAWLRSAPFDLWFIFGVAGLALASGYACVLEPSLFPRILFLDLYLLGYHHVVSTFTRLAFDRDSFLEHRFLVVWLPIIVLLTVVSVVVVVGGWVLPTAYFYWQWFHYTRQSYGIERVYRAKASEGGIDEATPGSDLVTRAALYLPPLWGILLRSYQSPRHLPEPAAEDDPGLEAGPAGRRRDGSRQHGGLASAGGAPGGSAAAGRAAHPLHGVPPGGVLGRLPADR